MTSMSIFASGRIKAMWDIDKHIVSQINSIQFIHSALVMVHEVKQYIHVQFKNQRYIL